METYGKKVFLIDSPIISKEIAGVHADAVGNRKVCDEINVPSHNISFPPFDVSNIEDASTRIDDDVLRHYYHLINNNSNARIYGISNAFNILFGFASYTLIRSVAFLNTIEIQRDCQRRHAGSFLLEKSILDLQINDGVKTVLTDIVSCEDSLMFFDYCGFTNYDDSPIIPEQANYELTPLKYLVKK